MAEDIKQATLVRGDEKRVVGVDTPEAKTAFSEGFMLPEATVKEQVVEPEIINKTSLKENIQGSLKTPNLPANEAFIQGVSKFATGKPATAEQIGLVGKPLSEIIQNFGVGEQFDGFGIAPKTDIKETAITENIAKPKTVIEEIREIRNGLNGVQERAVQTSGVLEAGKGLEEAQLGVQDIRNKIAQFENISLDKLEDIGNKPLSNFDIAGERKVLSREQQRELRDLKQDYNNALIIESIKQGSFFRAEQIAKDTAEELRQDINDEIDLLLAENQIKQEEAQLLRDEADIEFDRQTKGFIRITPNQASNLPQDKIISAGGKLYFDSRQEKTFDPTTDFKNWTLAGGVEGTGMTFTEWQGKTKPTEPGEQSEYMKRTADMTLQTIDELIPQVSGDTTGWGAFFKGKLPGSEARSFATQLDTLKGNIGFGALTAMREASKTGGALGQVSDREIKLLTSTLGGLDQLQNAADFKTQLKKVRDSVERWNQAVAETGGEDYSW